MHDVGEVAPVRVQDVGLKIPVPELVKLTVPVGAVGLVEVSVTVAVQVVSEPQWTGFGVHETVVVVECNGEGLAVMSNVPAVL